MADDAFALSPISARASLPSEADYGAIRDAFMETSRGRWFLDEYAKRNRNADTGQVLDAVARLEAGLAARLSAQPSAASIVEAIRPLIAEARAAADVAMTSPGGAETIAGGRRAARIIREISWSLRETGTDPRICNILDTQLLALDAVHELAETDARPAQVGEVFDDLLLRVEEIAAGAAVAAPMKADAPAAKPAAKPEPVERVGANLPVTEPDDAVAPDVDALKVDAIKVDAVKVDAPDIDATPSPTVDELAADDAVLDLIAMEMTAPDSDEVNQDDADDDAISELHGLAAGVMPPAAPVSPPTVMTTEMPIAPPAASPAAPYSLGAALIANGIVPQPRRNNDALAPFRRMSQIEKIAFFS